MNLIPELLSGGHVQAEVNGCLGLITLNRPEAMNALTLPMIRDLTRLLQHWHVHPAIQAVVLAGRMREGKAPETSAFSTAPRWRAIPPWATSSPRSTRSIT